MYVLKTNKEIIIKTRVERTVQVLIALLQMDDIPYSLYGEDGQTRITIDIAYKDQLQCYSLDWRSVTDSFREFFSE